ncbi:hypothetical protein EMGR_000805 [Emarellia grisea]
MRAYGVVLTGNTLPTPNAEFTAELQPSSWYNASFRDPEEISDLSRAKALEQGSRRPLLWPHAAGMESPPPASHAAKTKSGVIMAILPVPAACGAAAESGVYCGSTRFYNVPSRTPWVTRDFVVFSFVSVLGEGDGANELVTAADESSAASSVPAWWAKRASEVVGHLVVFPALKQLILEFYGVSQAAVIAAPFILNALSQMQDTYHAYLLDQGEAEIPALVETVLDNTGQKFNAPPTVDGAHFHRLYTGSCLRLEILGVVYALAGRASQFGLGEPKNKLLSSRFARRMLAASDTALETCRYLSPVNDLTLWLLHENLLLSTLVLGHSSSVTWHRLGELATCIFELGLHQDSDERIDLPDFLLESRRRLFAAVYQLDKSIVTFLGRPPRISRRHSNCRLPLDISDEALTGSRELAQRSVTAEGWSCHAVYQRSAWIRVRFLISTFREEILELSLTKPSENREEQLSVKVMLIVSYLAFLYNEFLVQRLLALNSTGYSAALVDVSSTILSTVLTFGRQQEWAVDIHRDFIWTLLLYGFPSASVLLRALQMHASTSQLPSLYPRGILVRHLSVFISHLESMAGPDTGQQCIFQPSDSSLFSHHGRNSRSRSGDDN